jgi:hypothetical protein
MTWFVDVISDTPTNYFNTSQFGKGEINAMVIVTQLC